MSSDQKNPAELTREKSLWDVYKLSRKIPHSRFNCFALAFTSIALGLYTILSNEQEVPLKEHILKLAELAFNFAVTILGFLVAGFTIFATISKPELLLEMQNHEHPHYKLSWLKYNFAVFFRVFGYYLAFGGICSLILIFGQFDIPWKLVLGDNDLGRKNKVLIMKLLFFIIGTGWVVLLLSLKSFVFNIYHVVMTALRWEAERKKTEERP